MSSLATRSPSRYTRSPRGHLTFRASTYLISLQWTFDTFLFVNPLLSSQPPFVRGVHSSAPINFGTMPLRRRPPTVRLARGVIKRHEDNERFAGKTRPCRSVSVR